MFRNRQPIETIMHEPDRLVAERRVGRQRAAEARTEECYHLRGDAVMGGAPEEQSEDQRPDHVDGQRAVREDRPPRRGHRPIGQVPRPAHRRPRRPRPTARSPAFTVAGQPEHGETCDGGPGVHGEHRGEQRAEQIRDRDRGGTRVDQPDGVDGVGREGREAAEDADAEERPDQRLTRYRRGSR